MRNDAASVLLAASRRALHARTAPNPHAFPANFNDAIMISFTHEREALSEAVLIRVSYGRADGIQPAPAGYNSAATRISASFLTTLLPS